MKKENEIKITNQDGSLDSIDLHLLQILQSDASASNQDLAALVHVSPPTCLRRIKRLHSLGLIERQVAILQPDRMRSITGAGLTAIVEITLTEQTEEVIRACEERLTLSSAVQQCYRTSPGPDLIAIVQVLDMPAYHALAQQLFTQDAHIRNVRVFFATSRSKFSTALNWLNA
ncbi:MAG: Lrp/AsnC family transcriptional regulator [Brachymonas sp.]|nr:Lrp/AsnC family transcriptional regulator [Brachymonas sp.]